MKNRFFLVVLMLLVFIFHLSSQEINLKESISAGISIPELSLVKANFTVYGSLDDFLYLGIAGGIGTCVAISSFSAEVPLYARFNLVDKSLDLKTGPIFGVTYGISEIVSILSNSSVIQNFKVKAGWFCFDKNSLNFEINYDLALFSNIIYDHLGDQTILGSNDIDALEYSIFNQDFTLSKLLFASLYVKFFF